MKRKGFTLVELLIVVAIIGVLAATMTMSSTDAIDSAGANNILSNLQSLKTAAMEMYMEDSVVASAKSIALGGTATLANGTDTKATHDILAGYLGKKSGTTTLGIDTGTYSLVGSDSSWYVIYYLADSDTAGVRAKLKAKANDADLYGGTAVDTDSGKECLTAYYTGGTETIIGLKVR